MKTQQQFLLFSQAKSVFALDIRSVREALSLEEQSVTPVPNSPTFLLGLTNLRGEILPVADFGRFINNEEVNRSLPDNRILVVESPNPNDVKLPPIPIGLAVDKIEGVLYLEPDKIVSAEEVDEDIAPLLRGLYDYQGRLLLIVDVEAIAQSNHW